MVSHSDVAAQPPAGRPPAASPRPPRRFRRRLLLGLVLVGLLPPLVWGAALRSVLGGVLAMSPPVAALLARASGSLERAGQDPLTVSELRLAELHLAQADLARRQLLVRAPLWFLVAAGLSAALIAGAAFGLGRRLSRPVELLVEGMGHYARGEFAHQVPVSRRGDELDYLAAELNRLGGQLQAQRQRLQVTEALAAWREAARALAHDLKNPLTAMRMALGRLTRPGRTEAALAEAVALLQDELDVLIRMSGSFAEFARLPDPERRPLDVAALVEEVGRLYQAECPGGGLEVSSGGAIAVLGDGDQLRRAVGNLVKNAIEASRAAGASHPVALTVRSPDPALVRIEVRDHGTGIQVPVEGAELMRGLRSSKGGGGRGLGLPIAHKIVHDHGGRLRLDPGEGQGTRAVVELPVYAGPASPGPGVAGPGRP
jgi:nitrogen fixation/metabolism regulation signal transduction histidine kinase